MNRTGYQLHEGHVIGPDGETGYYFHGNDLYGPYGFTHVTRDPRTGRLFHNGAELNLHLEHSQFHGNLEQAPWIYERVPLKRVSDSALRTLRGKD